MARPRISCSNRLFEANGIVRAADKVNVDRNADSLLRDERLMEDDAARSLAQVGLRGLGRSRASNGAGPDARGKETGDRGAGGSGV